ncbi:hypothetical protein NHG22_04455 [Streptomyces sp. ATE26]|uniref:hypothetical protein n=1 Tax=Streptomyces sp. ATE26 TaxID=2954237 RepID=UPI002482CCCE|nr:hypothetical protein [Streptomyces sp. ATE26]MDI1453069.1 hypothetical protein [Streptomyces sp. ATE26]
MEKLAGEWWESGSWWQFAITILAGLVGCVLGAWAAFRSSNPKRKINWWIRSNTPLFNRPAGDGALLNVTLGSVRLTSPRIVELVISNSGRRDVTAEMFHGAEPIKFDFDHAVAAVLDVASDPEGTLLPQIETWQELIPATGGQHRGGLLIKPALLRRGETITVTVLIDGEKKQVRCVQFPLIDVEQTTSRPGTLSRDVSDVLQDTILHVGPIRIRVGR